MNARTLVIGTFAAAALAACATQEPPKPAPQPAPAPAPAPTPAPAPRAVEAPKPQAQPEAPKPKPPALVSLSATELFDFNKAMLRDEARATLEREVLSKLQGFASIRYININGHADRLGSVPYNQQLSEKRAEAVREYLVSKGADASKIETFGFGKTMPVKSCPGKMSRKELIECLQPNRRVVVEIQGTPR